MIRRALAIAAILSICVLAVWAGTTPATNCGTGADVVITGGKVWTSPSLACTNGGTAFATAIAVSGVTDYLAATNYGFSIPGGATILGVQMAFKRAATNAIDITDNSVFLTKNGTVAVGIDHASAPFWPGIGSPSIQTYGATNDLWGATLAPADVNAATFGVLISAANNSATNTRAAYVYGQITITITYSTLATGSSPGIIGTITRQGFLR